MELYHGSSNKFNKFDYSKIRTNGTSEGLGFYFTDSKEIASQYGDNGYLYTVKLNANKSLSDNEKTISKNDYINTNKKYSIIMFLDKNNNFALKW